MIVDYMPSTIPKWKADEICPSKEKLCCVVPGSVLYLGDPGF